MANDDAEIRGMILAAGLGTRLRPLTDTTPKPLVEVGGRPLIEYGLHLFARSGVRRVVVNLHHMSDKIREYLGNGSRFGLAIDYSVEEVLQDTGGGIRDARKLLGQGTFITLNSDTIIDIDIAEVLAEHRQRRASATLVLREDSRKADFGIIETAHDGRVCTFLGLRAPAAGQATEALMYTGLQILEPRVFDFMPERGPFSVTRFTYPRMLEAGEAVYGHKFTGQWLTVGTPKELAEADRKLHGNG